MAVIGLCVDKPLFYSAILLTILYAMKDKGKLPLFCGNGERVNPIYAPHPRDDVAFRKVSTVRGY